MSAENNRWLSIWEQQQTAGFHQRDTNELLQRFWPQLHLPRGSRVLVPLCGKSLDMLWLVAKGYQVVGVELSPVAVAAFFADNHLEVVTTQHPGFSHWQAENIEIFCGDFFQCDTRQLGLLDAVYDRAAMTALPEQLRQPYVRLLATLITLQTQVVLLTLEDGVASEASQLIDTELLELFKTCFQVLLTHSEQDLDCLQTDYPADLKVYSIRLKPWPGCQLLID